METIYHASGRDRWLVAFETTVKGIDNIVWHCREEWMIIFPMALMLAYMSFTLQLSPTFPYFRHQPLSKSAAVSPATQYGPLLPLHNRRKELLVAGQDLFKPNFSLSPSQSASSSSRSPPHLPSRPSPLRQSFSHDGEVQELELGSPSKTSYLSPLTSYFATQSHIATTTAIPTQFQNQSNGDQQNDGFCVPATLIDSTPVEPSLRTRPNAQPKKAKSMDNFRATLFPLLEVDELEDSPEATKAVWKTGRKYSHRLTAKQRARSMV
ncbi:hypothetical protein QFC22_001929 [Naganishia vaughanmartiniae]|uniref:Uncharacterized protein n=1 Tax=Naganishia vaughanmartiniae TaxID=1424756 RepID=A0ACC2XEM6_9TREE|nr:hypothetical protein QFC22_001929 [Naganishia vaughanmartiniae]